MGLIEQRVQFSDQMEEALQNLADIACKATGHSLGINTNRIIAPEGYSLHLKFAEHLCVIELEGGEAIKQAKQVKLTDLPTASGGTEPEKKKRKRRASPQSQAALAALVHNIRDRLALKPMTISQLAKSLRLGEGKPARARVWRALHSMRDVRRDGVKNSVWSLKGAGRNLSAPRKTRSDAGVARGPQGHKSGGRELGHAGPDHVKQARLEGRLNLGPLIVKHPILPNIKLALLNDYWHQLYDEFGNDTMDGDEAAKVLGCGYNYANQLLRHFVYLGCAKSDSREQMQKRRFELLGSAVDISALSQQLSRNGAATTEPPDTQSRRPSIQAAIRAKRAE